MIDMSFGVFPMMTIISGMVLAILTARFVYVDRRYAEMIDRYQRGLDKVLEGLENDESGKDGSSKIKYLEVVDILLAYREAMGMYSARRDNNRHTGIFLDLTIVLSIIILGLLTASQTFEISVSSLVVFLVFLTFIPIIHFVMHMRILNQEKQSSRI